MKYLKEMVFSENLPFRYLIAYFINERHKSGMYKNYIAKGCLRGCNERMKALPGYRRVEKYLEKL